MKKIVVRKAGTIRLTSVATTFYDDPSCPPPDEGLPIYYT